MMAVIIPAVRYGYKWCRNVNTRLTAIESKGTESGHTLDAVHNDTNSHMTELKGQVNDLTSALETQKHLPSEDVEPITRNPFGHK
jgi:hypothetical protein